MNYSLTFQRFYDHVFTKLVNPDISTFSMLFSILRCGSGYFKKSLFLIIDSRSSVLESAGMFWLIFAGILAVIMLLAAFDFNRFRIKWTSKDGRQLSGDCPPPMKRRYMTVEQLRQYDGTDADGRICIAVNGDIYDVTRKRELYGQGGPYGLFAGRDASRCLAKFSTEMVHIKDTYDDLADLTLSEINSLREWAMQFAQMYPCVGKLLSSSDQADFRTDDEEEDSSLSDCDVDDQ
ncbi:Membrane-associated progesterone receptor component 2 [Trichinella patagoniensis]|uniref:Membrane-associated progesterone receptor component 2 n=1 Tax=Trichinella patagoniensis TaxID=990121 RepID=A0A0V1A816_9BILA|nr:Membrane-associated progesterone receptor component 2 [Trichinella patagoniensis]